LSGIGRPVTPRRLLLFLFFILFEIIPARRWFLRHAVHQLIKV
jgi:hypothetical protein